MNQLEIEFKSEASGLVQQLQDCLDKAEEGIAHKAKLEQFGQVVDRIMGGARILAMTFDNPKELNEIGSLAGICKEVGYKGSQIEENAEFYAIVVALLLDATEILEQMVNGLGQNQSEKRILHATFLDRLRWVAGEFDSSFRASLSIDRKTDSAKSRIDALLKNMGLG